MAEHSFIRREYQLESAVGDGEHLTLIVVMGQHNIVLRFTPNVARRLAKDLVTLADSSDEFIGRKKATPGSRA